MDRNDARPAAVEPGPPLHPHTCGRYPVLWLFEHAHRTMTGRPLCLSPADVPEGELHRHLTEERCPTCLRWFGNACRAYERIVGAALGGPPGPGREPPAYTPAARTRFCNVGAAADSGQAGFQQKWAPVEGGAGLDALTLTLEWVRDPGRDGAAAVPHRWWVTLKFLAAGNHRQDGNDEEALPPFDGCRVRLERCPEGGGEPQVLETRLGLDPDHNLVSPPTTWVVFGPELPASLRLVPLGRAGGPDCL